MPKPRTFRAKTWRSGLEEQIAQELTALGIPYAYEETVIRFVPPPKERRYTPDFVLPNGIIIETKGQFIAADRLKHLMVKAQHPDLDIRFVFSNAHAKIYKGSSTTCASWCDSHGFMYAHRHFPKEWAQCF